MGSDPADLGRKRVKIWRGACYGLGMKAKNDTKICPLTGQLLDDVVEQDQANQNANFPVPSPSVGETPLPPPDLYQDDGGGYNRDLTFPQQ